MLDEPTWPTTGLTASPSALALAPDDGALFALADHALPAPQGEPDEAGGKPPCGALVRLRPEGPEILLRDRPLGARLVGGAGFVVLVEGTEERYVYAASVFDRATGVVTPLPLPDDSAGLLSGAALDDGAVVLAGNEQLFRVEGPRARPQPLLRGDVDAARVSMGSDLVAVGGWLVWTTTGDSCAPSQLHRAPLGGGEPESVLRAEQHGSYGRLAVHGDEVLVRHFRHDPRNGRTIAAELLAVDARTGAVRAVAALEPMGLRALVVVGGVAWALPWAIGVDAHRVGLRAVDLASGEVSTPAVMADERGRAMVGDERALFVSTERCVRRIEVRPQVRIG